MLRPLNTLTLLPSTIMQEGVFVTNVKWKFQKPYVDPDFADPKKHYYSPVLFLHDPIKKKRNKIQLRLTKEPGSNEKTYQIEYWHDNRWQWYSSVVEKNGYIECTVHVSKDIQDGSKTLEHDLRQYLTTFHGKTTVSFGGKTISIRKCTLKNLFDFIGKEHNEDFVIECEGKEFKVKKIILCARSPVFETMLSTNYFNEGRENRMVIKDCGYEVVEKMIEFFHTDFVKNTIDFEVELYEIARKYLCEAFMIFTRIPFVQKLDIENYHERLKAVRKHDDHETEKMMNEWYYKIHHLRR